jgi:hypothetical protein
MRTSIILLLCCLSSTVCFSQIKSITLKSSTGFEESFSSITEAYSAIPDSITASYFLEINNNYDGEFEIYPIRFTDRKGAAINKTITLRPAAGVSLIKISAEANNQALIILEKCKYIIIDGRAGGIGEEKCLIIENLSELGSTILFNASSYNTLKYSYIISNSENIINIEFYSSWSTGNSNNIIEHCSIEGGIFGVALTSSDPGINNVVRNCEIANFESVGIYLNDKESKVVIEENKIYQKEITTKKFVIGISGSPGDYSKINRNWIMNLQAAPSGTVTGIRLNNQRGFDIEIYNNFISLAADNHGVKKIIGIEIGGPDKWFAHWINTYHNSIFIGGNDTLITSDTLFSSGIVKSSQGTNGVFSIRNNLSINKRTASSVGFHTGGIVQNLKGEIDVDLNVYFASGDSGSYHAGWIDTYYNDLWQFKLGASPAEASSKFKNISFQTETDLHLTADSWNDTDLKGFYTSEVTKDFDNEPRNFRYIGADELVQAPTDVKVEKKILPEEYYLYQNFPNPFNPTTKIKYQVPRTEFISLKIYDILGNEVTTLLNEAKEPGEYEIEFDGSKLSSGVYFYTLRSGSFYDTKKFILMK